MVGDFNTPADDDHLREITAAGEGLINELTSLLTHRSGSTLDHVITKD